MIFQDAATDKHPHRYMLLPGIFTFLPFFILVVFLFGKNASTAEIQQLERTDIAKVWAGHPVNFAIKTVDKFQCIAYYDTTRKMVVASRTIGDSVWKYTTLPTTTGGDVSFVEYASVVPVRYGDEGDGATGCFTCGCTVCCRV